MTQGDVQHLKIKLRFLVTVNFDVLHVGDVTSSTVWYLEQNINVEIRCKISLYFSSFVTLSF